MKVRDKICILPEKLQATVHAIKDNLAIVYFTRKISFMRYETVCRVIRTRD